MQWFRPTIRGDTPSPRNNHATWVHGTTVFVHGGHDGGKWLADCYCLDTETWTWSRLAAEGPAPSARACHTVAVADGRAYCFGGFDGRSCFNDLCIFDHSSSTWSQPAVRGSVPVPRNAQTFTAVGKSIYLVGGHSGSKHLRDLHVLDTQTLTWSRPAVQGTMPLGLRGHTTSAVGQSLYVFGGYDGRGRSNELHVLNTATGQWEHPTSNASTPAGRQRHTCCVVQSNSLLVLGGFDGFRWLPDLHMLDVSQLKLTAMASAATASLLTDLADLVDNPDSFPDVVFSVGGQRVHAHRSILCARSPHFRAMFRSGMREATGEVVTVDGWSAAAFRAQLEFLYTAKMPSSLSTEVVLELLTLADHNGLDGLKLLCSTALLHSLDATTAVAVLSTAHSAQATDLKRAALEYILDHNDEVDLSQLTSDPGLLIEVTKASLARQRR